MEEALARVREEKDAKKRVDCNAATLLADSRTQVRTLEAEIKTLVAERDSRQKSSMDKINTVEKGLKAAQDNCARLEKVVSQCRKDRDRLQEQAKSSISRLRSLLTTWLVQVREDVSKMQRDLESTQQGVERLQYFQQQENEEIINLNHQLSLKEFECHEMTICAAVMDSTKHGLERALEKLLRKYMHVQKRVLEKFVLIMGGDLQSAFLEWRRYRKSCARQRQTIETIKSRMCWRGLLLAFFEWRSSACESKMVRQRASRVVMRMTQARQSRVLQHWLDYHGEAFQQD